MENERYFLFNKPEDFPKESLDGLVYENGILKLAPCRDSGVFLSAVMDSSEDSCRWRRARLSGENTAGAELTFYAADSKQGAERMDGALRGPAPLDERLAALDCFAKATVSGTDDFLLSGVNGRYLAVCVKLHRYGDAATSLSFLQIWCRDESFLKYLPEIYHEDDSFLDRYLKLFATRYLALEREIEWLRECFDPVTAPDKYLRSLAAMVCIDHVRLWDTQRLRKLLAEGVYRRKGTLDGLSRLITIYTDIRPLIAERFRIMTGIEENDRLYSGSELTILLPATADCEMRTVESLHLIIQWFLPAGVDYSLQSIPDCVILSSHTYLGVNSRLSEPASAVLDEHYGIPYVALPE